VGGWRRINNEELHNWYTSPSVIRVITSRRMIWVMHVACVGQMRNSYEILVRNPEGKIPLGGPKHR
jgi:hypothetical protein